MAASLGSLGADHVAACIQRFDTVPWISHHVHNYDAMLVQLVARPLGRHSDSTDKKRHLVRDDNIKELPKLTASVVLVCCLSIAPSLGQQEVDAKWQVWAVEQSV